ncbi:Alpha/Beta hydrolase fold [Elaphomyces granulatus]
MGLPSPTFSFTIPSIYDGTQLECRLYLPPHLGRQQAVTGWEKKGAIIAHPYAPLGGCYDDPVVNSIGGELLQDGHIVGTFNFRGAGSSGGRTSWTAKPELGDYVSFYGFLAYYLHSLETQSSGEENGKISSVAVDILLGGYSYGSMIASLLPTIEEVLNLFANSLPASWTLQIRAKALELSTTWNNKFATTRQPLISSSPDPNLSSTTTVAGNAQEARIDNTQRGMANDIPIPNISYLLVSPILPPVSMFVTMFSRMPFISGQSSGISIEGTHLPSPKPEEQLCAYPTLAIFGDKDMFTPTSKMRKWVEDLSGASQSKFQSREINGAGHFWIEHNAESQMRYALRQWLRQTLSGKI